MNLLRGPDDMEGGSGRQRWSRLLRVGGVVLLLASGCSAHKPRPVAPVDHGDSPTSLEQPQLPFSVSVAQELNDGKRLYVKVSVDAHARWSTADAVLRLTGYRNGAVVGEEQAPLSALGPVLEQGSRHELPIILTASAITDYQVELLWGQDGRASLTKPEAATPPSPLPPLELRELRVHSERVACGSSQGCELQFSIAAELRNNSEQTITYAMLGTGFVWVDSPALDLSARIPENEATVELSGLNLGPGASRKIRLVLDQTVPERPDGAFQPVLRVVSSHP